MKLIAERQPFNGAIALYGYDQHDRQRFAAQPLMLQAVEEGVMHEPFMKLPYEDAQRLMDELWNCGLRPSEGSGSAGSLAATQRHLEDMRSLVFKTAKPK